MITSLLGWADSPFHDAEFPDVMWPERETEKRLPPALITLNYNESRIQSVIWDRWQYLKDLNAPGEREELYELAADPLAKTNLGGAHPVMEPIRRKLQQLLMGASAPTAGVTSTASRPMTRRQKP
jgi:hypothetical protein